MTGSASIAGPARPEKRVTARSRPCQKRCTGLVLPLNQPLNLEDGVRPVEDAAEALDRLSIPGRVLDVLGKRRRHRDPERLLLDLDVDAELGEHRVEAGVEVRDGHPVAELERPVASVGGLHEQGVIEEVERDLEGRPAMMQAPCRARGRRRRGAFHQWLRGAVVASRILPRSGRTGAGCLSSGASRRGAARGASWFVTTKATLSR